MKVSKTFSLPSILMLLIVVLSGCGSAKLDLPESRPNGTIEGKVLGGLYFGGEVTAYTFDEVGERQFLAVTEVSSDGSFSLQFAAQSQAVLVETRGGTYLDPASFQLVDAEPDFVMSKALMFSSAEKYTIEITPISHMETGLALHLKQEVEVVDTAFFNNIQESISDLYNLDTENAPLNFVLASNSEELLVQGNEKQGLLIVALAQIANEERLKRDVALSNLYNLATINNLIYEDIRHDGVLDGKSSFRNGSGTKTLIYGEQTVDFKFYRLMLAFAMQKTLAYTSFEVFIQKAAQDEYILAVAKSDSLLLGGMNDDFLTELMPAITLSSSFSEIEGDQVTVEFKLDSSLQLKDVKIESGDFSVDYDPSLIFNTEQNNFSLLLDTTLLGNGLQEFKLIVVDVLGNIAQVEFSFTIDREPPSLTFVDDVNVQFLNPDGTSVSGLLALENEVPLYFEINHLSLAGTIPNKENLTTENIPYVSFIVDDNSLSENTALSVSYRYLINEVEQLSWQSLAVDSISREVFIPFVIEALSEAWYKVQPDDNHQIDIIVSDLAGNITDQTIKFKAVFYVPELSITLDAEKPTLSDATYENRTDYLNKQVVGVNYRLFNPNNRSFKIRLNDDDLHSVTHVYDEVLRENKAALQAVESWRRSSISDLDIQCPTLLEDWQPLERLWNLLGADWIEHTPQVIVDGAIDVFLDAPVAPDETDWENFQTADQEVLPFISSSFDRILSYSLDYITQYDPEKRDFGKPSLIKGWKRTNPNIVCDDIISVQTSTHYEYVLLEGYPRNRVDVLVNEQTFSSSDFAVLNQAGENIIATDGWFEIPSEQSVTIVKYVKTPFLESYNDSQAIDETLVVDYAMHRSDQQIHWEIGQNLMVDIQFDPEDVLGEVTSVRQQVLEFETKTIIIER